MFGRALAAGWTFRAQPKQPIAGVHEHRIARDPVRALALRLRHAEVVICKYVAGLLVEGQRFAGARDHDVVRDHLAITIPDRQRLIFDNGVVDDLVAASAFGASDDDAAPPHLTVDDVVRDDGILERRIQLQPVTGIVPNDIAANDQFVAVGVHAMIKLDVAAIEFDQVVLDDAAALRLIVVHPRNLACRPASSA